MGIMTPPGKIYLIVNYNAPMSGKDSLNWPPAKVAKFFDGRQNPPTNTRDATANNNFIAEFKTLAQQTPRPEGLVVHADPYFRLWRTAFVIALADQLPVPVCYPYNDYISAVNSLHRKLNINNSIALDEPPLNNPNNDSDPLTAYFQLGKQVGRYLAGTANVKVVTWDPGNKSWSAPS
jgi:hypothetical protein